ncbi:class D beta-lactamase [Hymenobacter chitinivorans]|uniref:Beta-lactamase n=1 Tax=Hymenobacter chitinivorans DSM 11115 TaxID=1121954 RepID=A0A2M9BLR0_9BACT|nr:class D beta-lactamase [Hymenobacter chitinivorans]PJJ58872.1 beta-lactamase class D [Hymenobacter chitinivorans DSM 11115]
MLHFRFLRFAGLLLGLAVLLGSAVPGPVVQTRDFSSYFAAHGLRGSLLVLNGATGQYTAYDEARCRQGFLPASTFKIPNTLIGLETGAVRDTAEVFRWDGKKRSFPQWNQDMSLAQALRVSCVPCYQQIARRVGAKRYQQWLPKLRFGRMQVTPATVDSFWLVGSSRITQFEQIDFLQRLQQGKLPISKRNQDLTKTLLELSRGPGWVLRGKTGWAMREGQDNGWFVGWVEQTGQVYFFALNVEPADGQPATSSFGPGRRALTEDILRQEFGLLAGPGK